MGSHSKFIYLFMLQECIKDRLGEKLKIQISHMKLLKSVGLLEICNVLHQERRESGVHAYMEFTWCQHQAATVFPAIISR